MLYCRQDRSAVSRQERVAVRYVAQPAASRFEHSAPAQGIAGLFAWAKAYAIAREICKLKNPLLFGGLAILFGVVIWMSPNLNAPIWFSIVLIVGGAIVVLITIVKRFG